MEIKAKLLKPYTEEQRLDFIVEQNHNKGYELKETEKELQAWGYTEEEKKQQEKESVQRFSMTKQDFFNYVLKPNGFTYDSLMQIINSSETYQVAWNFCERVYRGDKNLVGALAKFLPQLTDDELDELFKQYGE